MQAAYNLFIQLYGLGIFIASLFYPKAKLWILGRKNWAEKLKHSLSDKPKTIWVHCSSLGEFEQARPLIEQLKTKHKEYFILLTFFSPSGYEVRKNYAQADLVCYLPLDTNKNASLFLEIVQPSVAIFTKYDVWPNFLSAIKSHHIPSVLFAANFRANQHYFKWYGAFFRKSLSHFTHILVQNETSKMLLQSVGINAEIACDTRFDRVKDIANQPKNFPHLAKLTSGHKVFVAGSTWPEDEKVILSVWPLLKDLGYILILAPHEVSNSRLQSIKKIAGESIVLFSKCEDVGTDDAKIILVDTIGDLTSIYSYGSIAFVGGGFGTSVHNILEPAAHGLPVLFGPNYHKSLEAFELIRLKSGGAVSNGEEIVEFIKQIDEKKIEFVRKTNLMYIDNHLGGTSVVLRKITQLLRL